MDSTPKGRFNQEEAQLFEQKGWLNYARRLMQWRWTGKDTAFPARQQAHDIAGPQSPHTHDANCGPGCGPIFIRPATGKAVPRAKGKFTAEAIPTPEPLPLRLSEAGVHPLEGVAGKGLAILGGTAALGVILHGGLNTVRGINGYHDPETGERKGSDLTRLAIGVAELGAGAAGIVAAATGRIKLWNPVQMR